MVVGIGIIVVDMCRPSCGRQSCGFLFRCERNCRPFLENAARAGSPLGGQYLVVRGMLLVVHVNGQAINKALVVESSRSEIERPSAVIFPDEEQS